MSAWSPPSHEIVPRNVVEAPVDRCDEALLRGLADDTLLVIDYPRDR